MMDSNHGTASDGFTLIELMIVIGIIGILSAIAVPQYSTYQKRVRFSEVVMATSPYKTAAELAVQLVRAQTLDDLDAGRHGIPEEGMPGSFAGHNIHSIKMTNGKIVAIGTALVDSASYTLEATFPAGVNGIRWVYDMSAADSCFNLGLC